MPGQGSHETRSCLQVVISSAFESPAALAALHWPLAAAVDAAAAQRGMQACAHGLGTDRWFSPCPESQQLQLTCQPPAAQLAPVSLLQHQPPVSPQLQQSAAQRPSVQLSALVPAEQQAESLAPCLPATLQPQPFSSSTASAAGTLHWRGLHWSRPSRPQGAPKLLLLHGFLGSSADWSPLAAALSSTHECLALDLPGHGSLLSPGKFGEHPMCCTACAGYDADG